MLVCFVVDCVVGLYVRGHVGDVDSDADRVVGERFG